MTIIHDSNSIHSDPFVKELLKRIPDNLNVSFTDSQLSALSLVFAKQSWRQHPIDIRKNVGLLKWRYYFVFIAGRDLRQSRLRDRPFFKLTETLFLSAFLFILTVFGLLLAYLVKSALGIDIFPGYSFGIWSWFKTIVII